MQGQLTDERILYRCRKTVLEMLRDRGYEIGDAEIEALKGTETMPTVLPGAAFFLNLLI